MEFLMQQIGPFPLVVWIGILVGGGILAWWLSRRLGGGRGTTASAPTANPNIDQSTGLPYTVENATDPNTGLPVYTLYNPPPAPLPAPQPNPQSIGAPCDGGRGIWQAGPNGPVCVPISTIVGDTGGGPTGPPTPAPVPSMQYQTAYGSSWPEPNHTLFDMWQDHGAGIPWASWETHVRRLNPQVGKSGRLYPNEAIRIP